MMILTAPLAGILAEALIQYRSFGLQPRHCDGRWLTDFTLSVCFSFTAHNVKWENEALANAYSTQAREHAPFEEIQNGRDPLH
jgi:hypothetical protein